MAQVRRDQGYSIPYSPYGYLAVNDCDRIGDWGRLIFDNGRRTPPMPIVDCAHPYHLQYRWNNNLVADAPLHILQQYAGRRNWTKATLIVWRN